MISSMICPPCEITDQLAVGTQNCFSTLFYTPYTNIKTSAQNASKCTIARQKNQKNLCGGVEGHGPLPIPLRQWATPFPSAPQFSRLRRSRSFSFTTRTLCKIDALDQWCLHMLLGIKWYQFVRNDDVRRLTKQPKLTAIIQLRRLTLFGHIMCMDDNADDKRILLASLLAD